MNISAFRPVVRRTRHLLNELEDTLFGKATFLLVLGVGCFLSSTRGLAGTLLNSGDLIIVKATDTQLYRYQPDSGVVSPIATVGALANDVTLGEGSHAGKAWVASYLPRTIQQVDIASGAVTTFASELGFFGLEYHGGYIYSTAFDQSVRIYDAGTGALLNTFTLPTAQSFIGIRYDALNERLVLSDFGGSRINTMTLSGGFSTLTGVASPYHLAIEPDGNVLVANDTSALWRVNVHAGNSVSVVASGSPINEAVGVTADSLGHIYAANFGDGNLIRVNNDGSGMTIVGHMGDIGGRLYSVVVVRPAAATGTTGSGEETTGPSPGRLDATWTLPPPEVVYAGVVNRVFVDPQKRVLLSFNYALVRLNPDGAVDASFHASKGTFHFDPPNSLAFQPDGGIVFGGIRMNEPWSFGRFNADGSPDFVREMATETRGPGYMKCIALQGDGKILVVGAFDGFALPGFGGLVVDPGSPVRHDIARFNPDGTWDSSFDAGSGISGEVYNYGASMLANALAVQPDGKILVGGSFSSINGQSRFGIARLNSDGSLDDSFSTDWTPLGPIPQPVTLAVRILPDGKILLAGIYSGNQYIGGLLRLYPDGALDDSFVPFQNSAYIAGSANDSVKDLVVQQDGRIIIGGRFSSIGGVPRRGLARLNPDGSVDPSFAPDEITGGDVESLALQDEGHLLIAGSFSAVGGVLVPRVARILTGAEVPDSEGSTAPAIQVQPSSQSVTSGTAVTFAVSAMGTEPLTYQWRKGGMDISGASGSTFTLPSATVVDSGDYDVVISNPAGSVSSVAATLTVNKATPVLMWSNPSDISCGTPLGASQLDATANVFGTFVYTPSAGTFLPPGMARVLSVAFIPDDAANLNAASASVVINVIPVDARLTSISPTVATAGSPAFILTINGSCFAPDAIVLWNGSPRAATSVGVTQLQAAIPASDIASSADLTLVSITVENPGGSVSNPQVFTIANANVGSLDSGVATVSQTVTVSDPPTAAGEFGVQGTLYNEDGAPVLFSVATYSGTPPSGLVFDAGANYYDIKVSGADASDSAMVKFYYPSTVTGSAENKLRLTYFNGTTWVPVRGSHHSLPGKNVMDDLDATVSGGRFSVVFDETSTPKLTQLSGTVFAVANTTPVVSVNGPVVPSPIATAVSLNIQYQAVGAPDTHVIVVEWDDGSADRAVAAAGGQTSASHAYVAAGVYTVRVSVTDENGDWGAGQFEYVVIYDPNGGFVTGGGWILSPPGALRPGIVELAGVEGKASFGFVAKYLKGASVPTGNTEFQFKAGNLGFKSSSYQWLVVSGARAQFKGAGTINGDGDYGFILTAVDGQGSGGGGDDRFRIKIWENDTGTIVYDNQPSSSDTAGLAEQAIIGGGSIGIQAPQK